MKPAHFAAVGALLLVAVWLLLLQTERPLPPAVASGYEVRGLSALHYDEQGRRRHLAASLATRAPDASSVHLTQLSLQGSDLLGRHWHLRSQKGTLDTAGNMLHMHGAVRAQQGSGTLLRADSMQVWGAEHSLRTIYAEGAPLHFTYASPAGRIVHGSGQRMEYEVAAGRVQLFGHAALEREDGILRGEHIEYLLQGQAPPLEES